MANQEDELTQRERRAQRHSQNKRKDMPGDLKRAVRAYGPMTLIVLAIAGAAAGVYVLSTASENCPDPHWHATAAIFLPGMQRVDFAAPRSVSGMPYYDWDTHLKKEGNPRFSTALHMHQSATSPETGSALVGAAQWHMENNGKCVSVENALRILEIDASEDSLTLTGGHEQVTGQSGTFTANATSPLRWWVQAVDGTWDERTWSEVSGYQLKDGESLLIALGNYDDAQVAQMQSQIPAPISRVAVAPTSSQAPTTTAAATTTTTTTAAATTTQAPTSGNSTAQP